MMLGEKIGKKIKRRRKELGMSQEDVAQKVYLTRQAVSKWERGKSIPETDNILRLSELFGVSTEYLLYDESESDKDILAVQTIEVESNVEKSEGTLNGRLKYLLFLIAIVIGMGILCFMFIFSVMDNVMGRRQSVMGAHTLGDVIEEDIVVRHGLPRVGLPFTIAEGYDISVWIVVIAFISVIFVFFTTIWLLCSTPFYCGRLFNVNIDIKEDFEFISANVVVGLILTIIFIICVNHIGRATGISVNFGAVDYGAIVIYSILTVACIIGVISLKKIPQTQRKIRRSKNLCSK